MSMNTTDKWPWSWPLDVPVRLVRRCDGATIELVERGVIYDSAASVGRGYSGTLEHDSSFGRITLEYRIGRHAI